MRKPLITLERGETWKSRAVDLDSRFEVCQKFVARLRGIIYAQATGGAKWLCRTAGEYSSSAGTWWYQFPDGSVVAVDHDGQDVSIFGSMAEVLSLYSGFGSEYNKKAYAALCEVAAILAEKATGVRV